MVDPIQVISEQIENENKPVKDLSLNTPEPSDIDLMAIMSKISDLEKKVEALAGCIQKQVDSNTTNAPEDPEPDDGGGKDTDDKED